MWVDSQHLQGSSQPPVTSVKRIWCSLLISACMHVCVCLCYSVTCCSVESPVTANVWVSKESQIWQLGKWSFPKILRANSSCRKCWQWWEEVTNYRESHPEANMVTQCCSVHHWTVIYWNADWKHLNGICLYKTFLWSNVVVSGWKIQRMLPGKECKEVI